MESKLCWDSLHIPYMLYINHFAVCNPNVILVQFRLQETDEIPISRLFPWCQHCCPVPFCEGPFGGCNCPKGCAPCAHFAPAPTETPLMTMAFRAFDPPNHPPLQNDCMYICMSTAQETDPRQTQNKHMKKLMLHP